MSTKKKIAEEIDLREYVSKFGYNVGFKIPAGSYVKVLGVTSEDPDEPAPQAGFHITKVCLGPEASPKERAVLTFIDGTAEEEREIVCSSLSLGGTENDILDLVAEGDFLLGNPNTLSTAIHVLGRLTFTGGNEEDEENEYDDDDGEEDDDDEDEDDDDDEEGLMLGMDDDDDEDDDDDDDDFVPSSTVKIEHIPSDDEADTKKPSANGSAGANGVKRAKIEQPNNKAPATSSSTVKKATEDKTAKPVASAKAAEATKADAEKAPEPKASDAKKDSKAAEVKADAKKDAKASEGKADAKKDAKASEGKTDTSPPTADKVIEFIKKQFQGNNEIAGSSLGSSIASTFGQSLKVMGFEEKTLSKFIEAHGKGEIVGLDNGNFKLK